jgi:hypothetical protein
MVRHEKTNNNNNVVEMTSLEYFFDALKWSRIVLGPCARAVF